MTSDSSYNSTDSSLVTVDDQQSFIACDFVCSKTADQAYTHSAWSCSILHHCVKSHNNYVHIVHTPDVFIVLYIISHYYTAQYMCTHIHAQAGQPVIAS